MQSSWCGVAKGPGGKKPDLPAYLWSRGPKGNSPRTGLKTAEATPGPKARTHLKDSVRFHRASPHVRVALVRGHSQGILPLVLVLLLLLLGPHETHRHTDMKHAPF